MNGPIIDVAIGLTFVYVVLSLLASTIQEWIASFFGLRSRNLYKGVERLLGSGMAQEVYKHPMVRRLGRRDRMLMPDNETAKINRWLKIGWNRLCPRSPSYIDSRTLGTVLMVLMEGKEGGQGGDDHDTDRSDIVQILKAIRQRTPGISESRMVEELAEWFDEGMQRVSGWYRQNASSGYSSSHWS